MKRLTLSFFLIVLAGSLCMAAGEEESSSFSPSDGGSLTFMMPSPTIDMLGGTAALDEVARLYREHRGVEVEIVSADIGQYPDMLMARTAAGNMPDVFVLPYNYSRLADNEALEDLTSLAGTFDFYADPVPRHDKIYGIPFVMGAGGLLYNRVVFDMYGISRDLSSLSGNRGEFDGLSRYFRSTGVSFLAAGGRDFPVEAYILFDLCLAAGVLRYNPGFPEDLAGGRAGLHDQVFIRAAEQAAILFRDFPSSYPGMSEAEAVDMFQSGNAAVIPADTRSKDLFSGWEDPRIFAGFPSHGGGTVLMVYPASLGIGAYSNNKEAAVDFVRFLLSPEMQTHFTSKGTVIPVVRGLRCPAGPKQQVIRALDEAAYVAGAGFYDMMFAAGLQYNDILDFYNGLYRAGTEGQSVRPVVDDLSDAYYAVAGIREPAPSAAPASAPVPSGGSSSGGSGLNAPTNP